MQNTTPDPKNFILGLIFIFSGILLFLGFFFSIFLVNDVIFDSPFSFILMFFAMFFIMIIIIITGTFFIQKSTHKTFSERDDFPTVEDSLKSYKNFQNDSKTLIKEKNKIGNNFCPKCGSMIYYEDKFCLNCGNKI